jgi:hydroxymethylpyrimidine/phosphomethylpyrimidine kinase
LTIAGSDSCGGAGIQADIKTMTALGVYAMSAVTALTAQNTTGVTDILEVTPEFLGRQLDSIFTDIRPDAVKVGMISSAALAETVAERLRFYRAENLVVDPVMVSGSGVRLLRSGTLETLKRCLLPGAALVTPNLPEAEALSGSPVSDREDMRRAAAAISAECGCPVLCKGGHGAGDASDLLYREGVYTWFAGERIHNPNSHGTGCTLSSAIACGLAEGMSLERSIRRAKAFVTGALRAGLALGRGNGPLDHMWEIRVTTHLPFKNIIKTTRMPR